MAANDPRLALCNWGLFVLITMSRCARRRYRLRGVGGIIPGMTTIVAQCNAATWMAWLDLMDLVTAWRTLAARLQEPERNAKRQALCTPVMM